MYPRQRALGYYELQREPVQGWGFLNNEVIGEGSLDRAARANPIHSRAGLSRCAVGSGRHRIRRPHDVGDRVHGQHGSGGGGHHHHHNRGQS